MMEEHATIFYIAEKGYALAYDEDLAALQDYTGPRRGQVHPFILYPISGDGFGQDLYYTRLVHYRTENREREDRFVIVTPVMLTRMLLQFIEAYPNGIPDAVLVANYFKRRYARHGREPEQVSREEMDAIMRTPKNKRTRQKRFHRESRAKGLSAYI